MDNIDDKALREELITSERCVWRMCSSTFPCEPKGGTEYVEAVLLNPEEAKKRFKSKLAGLKGESGDITPISLNVMTEAEDSSAQHPMVPRDD